MPVYPVILAGQKVTAALLTSMQPLTIVKPADESVTSSTVQQNDNDLVLPVEASATYDFRCYLDYEGAAAGSGDISWSWAVPASATIRYTFLSRFAGPVALPPVTVNAAAQTALSNGAGNLCGLMMDGTLVVSSTAGSLQLKWAQTNSSATATTVHAQSKLWLLRTA